MLLSYKNNAFPGMKQEKSGVSLHAHSRHQQASSHLYFVASVQQATLIDCMEVMSSVTHTAPLLLDFK